MKRLLAILAVMIMAASWPLAAVASAPGGDAEMHDQAAAQGIAVPMPPQQDDGLQQDQQDANGDPHDLGGGFRGTGSAFGEGGLIPVWIGPVATLIMQLF